MLSNSSFALATVGLGTSVVALVTYLIRFDSQRRSAPDFKIKLVEKRRRELRERQEGLEREYASNQMTFFNKYMYLAAASFQFGRPDEALRSLATLATVTDIDITPLVQNFKEFLTPTMIETLERKCQRARVRKMRQSHIMP